MKLSFRFPRPVAGVFVLVHLCGLLTPDRVLGAAPGPALSATFSNVTAGVDIDLTREGEIDWVHWGLYTETSLDRKAGVVPQISDFILLDAAAGFSFAYQFADNANGYSWSDGTPTAAITNTTTGVWAYGTPLIGSGFEVTVPADTTPRIFKLYVGTYGARGQLQAFLSDNSARGYTNSSLFNANNGPGGVYTINYAAASAGKELILRWSLLTPARPDGNVTLQAAALTATNYNNPPFAVLSAPANNSSFSAGADISLTVNANDTDGTVSKVEFFANDIKLGEDSTSPFSFAWNNVSAGRYVITARPTDNLGATSGSAPVEIFVNGTGGSLQGSLLVPPAEASAINLTSEGTLDWAHWGLGTNNLFNQKAAVSHAISDMSVIGSNVVQLYSDNYTAFSWSDGTPTPAANNATKGIFITGVANGFEITAPADANSRTLKVYAGLYGAQGNFQAWLSDYSGTAYTSTTLSNFFGNDYGVYALTYTAASSGQTLHVRYRSLNLFDQDFGNVTFQAATLVENISGNILPSVAVTNPINGAVFTAPASFTLGASATDTDGGVAQVEFFRGTTSLGIDTSSPYSVPVGWLGAGTYTLSAVATDNLGAKATNSVSIVVNSAPTASISSPTNSQSFVASANITIDATAGDTDGTIAKVEFFEGANKLGEDLTSPYSLVWSNLVAGNYTLTVRATDNHGATGTSAAVSVSVVNNAAPSVSVTNPVNGAVFTAPASFTLGASADDTDGSVAQVEFFRGTTSLGIDTTSPYSVPVSGLGAGTYTLSAVATDNLGAKATNSVSIVVNSTALPVTLQQAAWSGAEFSFSFVSQSGHSYVVRYNDALGSGSWLLLTNVPGTGSNLVIKDGNPGPAQRAYRVETQ